MTAIDIVKLLEPVSAESPCGEDMAEDQAFASFVRSAQGGSAQRMVMGTDTLEAGPEWPKILGQATEWFSRTKDLRVAIVLTRGLLHVDGIAGLSPGLELIRSMLDRYWDGVHPRLDPADSEDTYRFNIVKSLSDRDSVVAPARRAALVRFAPLGKFGLRDIGLASGKIKLPEGSKETLPSMSTIESAFTNCAIDELRLTSQAVRSSLERVQAIEALVTERLGIKRALRLPELVDALREMDNALSPRLATREGAATPQGGTQGGQGPDVATTPVSGQVRGRQDVIRMLDLICEYYAAHEPSSPVPVLLKRCKRLVPMQFMEIVEDLVPGGLNELEKIRGPEKTSEAKH